MKLHELLAQYTWEEVCSTLKTLYAPSHINETSYKKAVSILKRTQWVESEFRIVAWECWSDDRKELYGYDVSGIRDNDDNVYSLVMTPWREWLGMEIEEKTLQNIPPLMILAECVYEMTWYGYSERQRKRELAKRFNRP